MKAQYHILGELRRVDEKVARLQREVERIPEELNKLEKALGGRREEYEKVKVLFEGCEKKLRAAESNLKEKEDKLHKAEGKMMEVKTNEEYQAAMKENQTQKGEKSGLEDQVLTLLNDVEAQRTQLKEVEKNFKTYESVVKEDSKKLQEEQSKIVAQLDEQLKKRQGVSSQLSPEISQMYHRMATRMKGVIVVPVENGMCSGCHMKMRPQLYNEILGFKTVHRCPSCGRILIIANADTEPVDTDLASK
jgi:uncharacterized protein